MNFFHFTSKLDANLKTILKTPCKKRIPVIVSCRDNQKKIASKITSARGKTKYLYSHFPSISAELFPHTIDKLSKLPEIKTIVYDYKASLSLKSNCEAHSLNFPADLKLTGKNIGIGIIDSGVFPHPELTTQRNSIFYFQDLINKYKNPYDDNGHGTFLCGCICAQDPLAKGICRGIAKDANIITLKAFDSLGLGALSDILAAMDILLGMRESCNLRILLLPFEFANMSSKLLYPFEEAILITIHSGISVIAPAGNHGPSPFTINSPGDIKEVITVAGTGMNEDNKAVISNFSGRGPILNGNQKPDLAAPSVNISSLTSDTSHIYPSKPSEFLLTPYRCASGTSIASALIAGAGAIILEKRPELKPADLKSMLCLGAVNLGENKYAQGKGLFSFEKILK